MHMKHQTCKTCLKHGLACTPPMSASLGTSCHVSDPGSKGLLCPILKQLPFSGNWEAIPCDIISKKPST